MAARPTAVPAIDVGSDALDTTVVGNVSLDGSDTAARLLDAAEELIAERGVEAVSLRAINAAAGANVAAVHYHFGAREQLVAAVLHRRMGALSIERLGLLEPLESMAEPPVRSVVEALVLPLARLATTPEGLRYVRFLAALDHAGGPWWDLVSITFAPQWQRFEPVLERALPGLPADIRRFRINVIFATLTGPALTGSSPLSSETRTRALVDIVTAVLSAPVTT